MVGICGSLYTIERFGRRTLILTATAILIVLNVCIASLGFAEQTSSVQSATLGLICIWVFSYSCGLSGSCWSAPAECPTLRLRAKTMSAILASNALANVLWGSTVSFLGYSTRADGMQLPLMLSSDGGAGSVGWGQKTLYLFVGLGSIGFGLNYLLLPEVRHVDDWEVIPADLVDQRTVRGAFHPEMGLG